MFGRKSSKNKNTLKLLFGRLFQKNKYEKPLRDLQAQYAQNPEDMRLKAQIAEMYFKARQMDLAIEAYEEIARTYIEQNFILKAVSVYKNILKLKPTFVEINLKLAALYEKLDMVTDAANQYRIALQVFSHRDNKEKALEIGKKLAEMDPTTQNLRKLAEIYQAQGYKEESIVTFEKVAALHRKKKEYDELLQVYELILPHKKTNHNMIKDMCILYLRNQDPDHVIRTLERLGLEDNPLFTEILQKADVMKKALRNPSVVH